MKQSTAIATQTLPSDGDRFVTAGPASPKSFAQGIALRSALLLLSSGKAA
jgi:hypothetical protein